MLKTFKKKRPKSKVKDKKSYLKTQLNNKDCKQAISDYRKGRY